MGQPQTAVAYMKLSLMCSYWGAWCPNKDQKQGN